MRSAITSRSVAVLVAALLTSSACGGDDTASSDSAASSSTVPADASAEPTDASAEPTDASAEPADASAEPTDASAEPANASAEPADASEESDAASEESDGSTVTLSDSQFVQTELRVAAGTTVTFKNTDPFAHTVTSSDGSPIEFDSGEFGQGETFEFTFDEPGEYPYFCQIHPTMQATIIVE